MIIEQTRLPGVLVCKPRVYQDSRGFFMELWNERVYAEYGLDLRFVQGNLSYSRRGVLRGLHYQNPDPQGKLVSVLEGEVFDVAVDIRAGSPTFGEWFGLTLSAENRHQVYIPPGFAHGFVVTGETALFCYGCTNFYSPEGDGSIRWDDPDLGIPWPVEAPLLSEKDAAAPLLHEVDPARLRFP